MAINIQKGTQSFKDCYFLTYPDMYLLVVSARPFPWYPSLAPIPDHATCRSAI